MRDDVHFNVFLQRRLQALMVGSVALQMAIMLLMATFKRRVVAVFVRAAF